MKRTIKVLTLLLASFMWMPLVGPEVQANEAPLPTNQAPVLSHEADKTSDASQVHSQTLPLPESKTQPNLDVSTNTPAKEEGTSGSDSKEAVDQPKGPANKVPESDSSKEKDSSDKGGETDPLKQLSDKPAKEEANQSSDKPSKEEANQPANKPTKEGANQPANKPTKEGANQPADKPTKEGANQPADKPTKEEGNQSAKEEATESAAAAQVESKQIMNLMNANASAKKINEPIAKETDTVIKEVFVDSLEDLQKAIDNATDDELTRIVLNQSIDVTQRIDVPKGKRIILTANNQKLADGPWQKIEQPADYAEEGEAKQREIIEEARKRVEQVRDLVDLDKNPLPDPSQEISLKRSDQFLSDSLFAVRGLLQLGDQTSSLMVDGNKTVKTDIEKKGVLFDVRGEGSKLFLKNGTLMNVNNTKGYAAPIYVGDHAAFEMDGGRITHNKITWSNTYPAAPGAIYGQRGTQITINNGLIDHNIGGPGAIYSGDFYGGLNETGPKDPGLVTINGGTIIDNWSSAEGGAILAQAGSRLDINDGLIVDNEGFVGGGIAAKDEFLYKYSNVLESEWGKVGKNYEEWLTMAKVEVNLNGGVIAGNKARSSGGGIYIATNFVNFNKTMLLDNKADQFGGGFYVSFPPYVQQLKNLLVTENSVSSSYVDKLGGGNGGGLWNCPTGYVHIGDGHTVYIYNNQSSGSGADLAFVEKTHNYDLYHGADAPINIGGKFYSHVSPVTEGYKDGEILELIKFLNDHRSTGQGPIPEHMSYADDWMYLKALYSQKLQKEAWMNAKTFILGNKARNGGGIGSNANMETPEDKGTYDLELKKRWIGVEEKNQTSVKVDIFIVPKGTSEADVREHYGKNANYYKYGEVELSSLNNWTRRFSQSKYAQFDDLPAHLKDHGLPFSQAELAERGYQYLVIERNPRGFVYTVEEVVPEEANRVNETVGTLELDRYLSQTQPSLDEADEADAFLYVERADGKFEKISEGKFVKRKDRYHTEMTHPLLVQVVDQEYYGFNRPFTEYGEGWLPYVKGLHVNNLGYAFYLKRNPKGEGYILQIP